MNAILNNQAYQKTVFAISKVLLLAFLVGFAITTIYPFVYSIVLSSHDNAGIVSLGTSLQLGDFFKQNYFAIAGENPSQLKYSLWLGMWNSFKVAGLGTIFSLFFCSMAGYALAVYKFRGSNTIFGFMIGSMMIPPILGLIPYYLIVDLIGLGNTHLAVWLPFTVAPIGIFLVRQYVTASIPKDLLESAKLDGAGEFRIYFTIVLPLLKPALATLAIIQFVMLWNNFLHPLVILADDQVVAILQVKSMQGTPDSEQGAVMMASFLSMLPLIVVFMVASKQMISGLTSGAVK